MDVLVLLLGFLGAAGAGWMVLKAEAGAILAVVAYASTFLAVVGFGVLLRRWRG